MMRRTFIELSSLTLAGGFLPNNTFSSMNNDNIEIQPNFTSDGIGLTPETYATLLTQLLKKHPIKADVYGLGDVIHNFEEKVAKALGKEKAIYMPTGTLANHIAMRQHAIRRKKVLVQQQSHVYRDCGDALQQLSGINLIPLATDKISFKLEDVENAIHLANEEKVKTGIEAISIETPVRRQHLRQFSFNNMKEISAFARTNNIAMHLDGARIFGEAAIANRSVQDYTNMFDTVYISLYKYFNSIAGAILAGPTHIINDLYHERRIFGGGLRAAWENVIVADYFFEGFEERFKKAQNIGLKFLQKLSKTRSFKFEAFINGTNVYKLYLEKGESNNFREKIVSQGIVFPKYNEKENCFVIKLNESILGIDVDELAQLFKAQV